MTKNPIAIALLAGAAIIAAVITLYVVNTTVPIGERPKQFEDLGGNFELDSALGDVNLVDYQGEVVVLYFGFLNCSEVCPSSTAIMSAAFKQVPDEIADSIQGFFVSVDPARDDVQSLYEFSQHFDERILGITGTEEEIAKVSDDYGVYYDIYDMENSGLSYTVDHVSRFYIIAPNGDLVESMSHSTTPIELAAQIKRTASEYASLMKGGV